MNHSTTPKHARTDRGAVPAGNAVVRFTPIPPQPHAGAGVAGRELPPELTYGCVDWFDYKNHPLHVPGKTEPLTEAPESRRR
jgi:hypothetical protein